MIEKTVPFTGWSKATGLPVDCEKRVFDDLGSGRQLVGYLAVLPSADRSFFVLRTEENGKLFVTINSYEASGIKTAAIRRAWAESCFRSFQLLNRPAAGLEAA